MLKKILLLTLVVTAACSKKPEPEPVSDPDPVRTTDSRNEILFLGTSLTAGYGVGAEHSFPTIIQEKIDSAKLPFKVVNAGLSGETSAGGLRRLDWSLQQPVDVFVLELGANDGLRGLSVKDMETNLDSILAKTRTKYPNAKILIAGMESPPNLGADYTTSFRKVYLDLTKKYDATLIPFLLVDVATKPELNQEDGIHPNVEGHKLVANTVWKYLQPILQEQAATK